MSGNNSKSSLKLSSSSHCCTLPLTEKRCKKYQFIFLHHLLHCVKWLLAQRSFKTEAWPLLTKVFSSPALFISFLVGSTVAEASSTHCSLRKHMQIDNLMMCLQTSNQARHCCSYLTDNPMEDGYTPGPPQSNFSQLSCIRSSAVSSNECSPCCEALDYKELKWQAHFRLTGSVESRQTGKHVSVTHRHPWPP